MKVISALAAIPLAILLLTWLSLQSLDTNAELFDRVLGEMDRFTMQEAALHRDVLNARAGMLRNYDPLVREVNGLEKSLARLHEATPVDGVAATVIGHLETSLARQEDLVEQFKSNNALLQNSLAYFGVFTGFVGHSGTTNGPIGATVSALATAMLRLTLDTSPANVQDVQDRLDELAIQTSALDPADPTRALLAHGRLLADLLPTTDRILRAFSAEPAPRDVQALRAMVVVRAAEFANNGAPIPLGSVYSLADLDWASGPTGPSAPGAGAGITAARGAGTRDRTDLHVPPCRAARRSGRLYRPGTW